MKESNFEALSTLIKGFPDVLARFNKHNQSIEIFDIKKHREMVVTANSVTDILDYIWDRCQNKPTTIHKSYNFTLQLESHITPDGKRFDLQLKIQKEPNVYLVESIMKPRKVTAKTNQSEYDQNVSWFITSPNIKFICKLLQNFNNSNQSLEFS